MIRRALIPVLAILALAPAASSQTTLSADRLRLNGGPCTLSSLDGTPDKWVFTTCPVLSTPAATNLTLNPTGDLILGPDGTDILPNTGYTQNLGALTNKYLTLHAAELWVETLVAQNTIATIGGRVLVGPTTTLTADVTVGATSITVKHNQIANGARIYLEANGSLEWMAVTSGPSGSGPYTYTVTRNLDGSGANAWTAGDAVFNTGTTGDGFIDLYSLSGVLSGSGPTIVGNVRTGTTYNNLAPRWAIGNLNGLYGVGSTKYGVAMGDPAATNILISATDGILIRSGTTNKLTADTSGNLSLLGDLSLGTSSVFRSSTATALNTGDGFYMTGGSSPTFRIGNPAGNRLVYDSGTGVLQVYGNGNGLTSIGPGSLTIGSGRNVIRNSDCGVGVDGWSADHSGGLTVIQGRGASGFSLNDTGTNTCYFWLNATPAGGTVTRQYLTTVIPVAPGSKYEASAYLGVRNATSAQVNLQWLQADGTTLVSESTGNTCTVAGGTKLSDFCRSGVIATAPGTAYNARLVVQMNNSATISPITYHVHNYFGEASSGQTELTPWGPAGVTSIVGGMIEANTITATNIAANTITADRLNVSSLSAISANIGTITAGSLSGVTATFGGGTVTLNSSGVSITAGTATANKIAWSNGASIYGFTSGSDARIQVSAAHDAMLTLQSGTEGFYVSPGLALIDGGIGGAIGLAGFAGGGNRTLCVNNSGVIYAAASC